MGLIGVLGKCRRWKLDNYLGFLGCHSRLVLCENFYCSMVEVEEYVAKVVFSSTFSGGSSSKVHSYIWCFCDKILCWYLGLVKDGSSRSLCPFAGR